MSRESGPVGAEEINLKKAIEKISGSNLQMDKAKGPLEVGQALEKGIEGFDDMLAIQKANDLTKEHVATEIQKNLKKRRN